MKKKLVFLVAAFAVMCVTALGIYAAVGDYTVLRHFAGGGDDGANAYSQSLTTDGAKLYGVTWMGGDAEMGTIYSMNTDGTGFALLHEFAGGG